MKVRKNTIGFAGGAFGDEGKGRIVDTYVNMFAKRGPVVVYRDNGGAGSGHTVELEDGTRVAFHQLPSGVFVDKAVVVLGKGMVLHPWDLVEEIGQIRKILKGKLKAKIVIDEMAVLSLDTHRAFEAVLKNWQDGSKGSTGRGIGPSYADVILRHPLRMRDLVAWDVEKLTQHYRLYEGLVRGLGAKLSEVKVPWLKDNMLSTPGSLAVFLDRLKKSRTVLKPHIQNVHEFLQKAWRDSKYSFVFEKAQGIGLDTRWGVYPDVSGSDMTFVGISSSTEGVVRSEEIAVRAAVIKATYMSSVGTRRLPTEVKTGLATRIREDAQEYGATTRRPRDIAYLDLAAIKFFAAAGEANAFVLTHMDIVYPKTPIKVCVGYTLNGKKVGYRPDQTYLSKVKPVYVEFAPWSAEKIQKAKTKTQLPVEAKKFLAFIEKETGVRVHMITTGPKREQGILFA